MGIQGLLPLLKSIMLPIHIRDLEGSCVAVDTYSWLHKGALSCSKELCKSLPTSKHIDYCMRRVNLLRHYGVKPVLVFDGGLLPMKSEQENKRARTRKENMSRAMEHELNGNLTAAYECYQKAVDISPSVAYELIQVLKQENIAYIVAPYEADAQMTFLAVSKQVDAIITEDSDLIAFGCPRVIYKMDKFGQGVEFRYSMIEKNKELNLTGFTKQMILEMCILSGCDYLQSLPGMGLKKAHALIKKFKTYDKVIKHLKYNSVSISSHYEESFKKALLTFQHQRVYDPLLEDIVHLSELPDGLHENLDFLGPLIPQHIAKGIATGDLDPFTKMPLEVDCDGAETGHKKPHHLKQFKLEVERKKLDLPVQKNLLTNYFCFASLEAKRKFRTPRNSPTQRNTLHVSTSDLTDVSAEAKSDKMGNSTTVLPESVENTCANVASEYLLQRCHGVYDAEEIEEDRGTQYNLLTNAIYEPSTALSWEHNSSSQSKVRAEKGKVVVRSSYFLKSSTQDRNQVKKSYEDDVATEKCRATFADFGYRSVSDDCEKKTRTVKKNAIVRSAYFQHKPSRESINYDKSDNCLVKETIIHQDKHFLGPYEVECKTTIDKGDGIWCSYSQQNSVSMNSQEIENVNLLDEDHLISDREKYAVPEISSFGIDILEGASKKRKAMMVDDGETEDARRNDVRMDAVLPLQSDTNSLETTAHDGKFGCNISHLGHYSEIAEKSMDNFVSVISSFRFTSNGSRASGLRAPLKDIRNTCISRSSSDMDLSKFVYAPTKKPSSTRPRA
ncbi:hypothetical protein M9H77_11094 [Catharanthus roseus]|uniref:Uncharacterized protein n=1 Tax=Catharanthus roseus TaxID=4058 RepID=A0ACC0BDH9_CATRO|nr:hypothetical protein M9H77_11094 [Catharanthus roseus]